MKKCLVAVANDAYLNHVRSLFGALKHVGKWDGDFVFIYNGKNFDVIKEFMNKGIKLYTIDSGNIDGFHAKFHVFSDYFKQWDRVIYFDCDFVIRKPIQPVFEAPGAFLADIEPFFVHQYWDKTEPYWTELQKETNVNAKGFNTSCMIYDTSLLEHTLETLLNLQEKYKEINHHTKLPNGTDQPIINIVFQQLWEQIPNICFKRETNNSTVAFHTCRWNAPWKVFRPYYDSFLRYFNEGWK